MHHNHDGFAGLLLGAGDWLWTPFAMITLGFAAGATKQLFARPRDHRP